MKKLIINPGDKFGNWVVSRELDIRRQPNGAVYRIFECLCVCGNKKSIRAAHLTRQNIQSCGCLSIKFVADTEETKYIRKIWNAIKFRTSKKNQFRHLYLSKGVTVDPKWLDFENFKKWAISNNLRKGYMIDRIDTNGNYTESNCRVVSPKENANNRIDTFWVSYNGERAALKLLLSQLGKEKHYPAIRGRIVRGWEAKKAIDTPIRVGNYVTKRVLP